jgi:hypothetical protein
MSADAAGRFTRSPTTDERGPAHLQGMSIRELPTRNSFVILHPQVRRPVTARELGFAAAAASGADLQSMFNELCFEPLLAA